MRPSDLFRNWFAEVWNDRRPDLMEKFVTEDTLSCTVPPTNKKIVLTGMAFIRVEDGMIVETWDEWNPLGLLSEIGAISFAQSMIEDVSV